ETCRGDSPLAVSVSATSQLLVAVVVTVSDRGRVQARHVPGTVPRTWPLRTRAALRRSPARLLAGGLQAGVEARIDAPGIQLEDLALLIVAQVERVDVALRVVPVVAGLGIDAPHRAEHLRGEEDVVDVDHAAEKIDA